MASIIIFATCWGFALREWAKSQARTKRTVWLGVAALILATVVIGTGNYMTAR
jgi:L-rhamnose-H+ transport protein